MGVAEFEPEGNHGASWGLKRGGYPLRQPMYPDDPEPLSGPINAYTGWPENRVLPRCCTHTRLRPRALAS